MLKWGPLNSVGTWLILGLSLALALTMRIEQGRLAKAQTRGAVIALALTNAEAERDSTRILGRASRVMSQLLGDSIRVYQRRIVQVAQQKDALDDAVGTERVARYALGGRVDSLERVIAAQRSRDSADFHIRQAPYTVEARVAWPPAPDSARLALHVALDAIPLDVRVLCDEADAAGIRTASVIASAPAWATLTLGRVDQSPNLCASPPLARSANPSRFLQFEPVVVGGGRIITPDGRGAWGFFAGSGVRVWI